MPDQYRGADTRVRSVETHLDAPLPGRRRVPASRIWLTQFPRGLRFAPTASGVLSLVFFSLAAWAQASESGRTIFEGKGGCLRCHSVANRGGSLGPDLTEIGIRRTPASLRLSITNPDA